MKPIRINPAHKGDLHRALNIPQNKPIPVSRIAAAKNSPDAHTREMANFAMKARGFKHRK